MEVLYATWSSERKSVMINKTYQKEKGGSSEGQHTKEPADMQNDMSIHNPAFKK